MVSRPAFFQFPAICTLNPADVSQQVQTALGQVQFTF
jgi:hypothetical protein